MEGVRGCLENKTRVRNSATGPEYNKKLKEKKSTRRRSERTPGGGEIPKKQG